MHRLLVFVHFFLEIVITFIRSSKRSFLLSGLLPVWTDSGSDWNVWSVTTGQDSPKCIKHGKESLPGLIFVCGVIFPEGFREDRRVYGK